MLNQQNSLAICAFTAALITSCLTSLQVFSDEKPRTPIRVAIFADSGVTKKSLPELERCLPKSEGFESKLVTAEEIRTGALDHFDVVICPGGSGSGQAKALRDDGRERVKDFVRRGGGFVGVCAGAYLASAEYPWALKLLDAHVVDDDHWARGVGKVKLRLPETGQAALDTKDSLAEIHYENGPLLGPANHDDIPDFESLATYDTEIRENDAPKGIMKGTTAIARAPYGDGRVVCFSPHPEKTHGRESYLRAAIRWAANPH